MVCYYFSLVSLTRHFYCVVFDKNACDLNLYMSVQIFSQAQMWSFPCQTVVLYFSVRDPCADALCRFNTGYCIYGNSVASCSCYSSREITDCAGSKYGNLTKYNRNKISLRCQGCQAYLFLFIEKVPIFFNLLQKIPIFSFGYKICDIHCKFDYYVTEFGRKYFQAHQISNDNITCTFF